MRRHPRPAEPGVGAGWLRELLCPPWAGRSQAYYGRDMGWLRSLMQMPLNRWLINPGALVSGSLAGEKKEFR